MRTRLALIALLTLILLAHVALWRSDMPPDMKLRLTLLNAAGWSVVLLPIYLVNRWLKATTGRNTQPDHRP